MKKKKKSPVLYITIVLFGVYMALYYMARNGYYDYQEYNKMVLTEEAMKRFEKDVSEGKDIVVSDYIDTTYKDYSNKVSDLGYKAGEYIEEFMTKGIGNFFKVLGKLVTN